MSKTPKKAADLFDPKYKFDKVISFFVVSQILPLIDLCRLISPLLGLLLRDNVAITVAG